VIRDFRAAITSPPPSGQPPNNRGGGERKERGRPGRVGGLSPDAKDQTAKFPRRDAAFPLRGRRRVTAKEIQRVGLPLTALFPAHLRHLLARLDLARPGQAWPADARGSTCSDARARARVSRPSTNLSHARPPPPLPALPLAGGGLFRSYYLGSRPEIALQFPPLLRCR